MDSFSILLNGKPHLLQEASLACLLESLKLPARFYAVAVNREVIAQSKISETFLKDGDEVEIVHPVGGG